MTNSTRCSLLAKQACTTLSHVVQKITPPSANNFFKLFFALFAMLALGVGNAWAAEIEMSTFTEAEADMDSYISYSTAKGGGTSNPAVHSGAIRLYQNSSGSAGGNITITAKNGATITEVTIGSSMGTSIRWEVNGAVDASNTSLSANGKVTKSDLSVSEIKCHCYGTTSSTRLYVNYLKVVYTTSSGETPGTGDEEPDPEPEPGTGGEETSYTWDLSTNSYSAASNTQVTWSATDVNMVADKGTAGTAPNNYLGGDANSRTSSRFYENSILTITPEANVTITSVVFTATTDGYATALKNSTWTNATATASSKTVTVTPTDGATAISAKIGATCGFTSVTVNYTKTSSGSEELAYSVTITQPAEGGAIEADKTEAKEGDIVKLTATPDAGYKWESWTVTGASGDVAVSNNQFTMPAEDVTVTASFIPKTQYTIKWNVAEGSVADTYVYEGEALGTLPEADVCSEGKVFMGWTAANEVNPNGLDIEYAKATDIPTDNTTYNAVYAKETIGSGEEGSAEVALASGVYDSTNKNITWTTDGYATILQAKGTSSTDVGNYVDAPRWYVGHNVTITPQSGVNITQIILTLSSTNKNFGHANTQLTNATAEINDNVITLKPINGESPITIVPGAQIRPTAITIHKGPITSYSHYSFDCEVVNDPYLNVDPTTITFDATNVGFNSTKTIDITAGYLTEDITLAISGENANEFSVSTEKITKDEEVSQKVTVTYAPTAEGNHEATLTITSGTLSKTVTLSGSAEVATIYTLTNLADINPNDKVIIVGNVSGETYAMSNDKGTDGAPTAVEVTVADNKIATNETNILWNIAKNGDNLTFYPNGTIATWLYCTSTNNGVRVGTNQDKTFILDATSGYLQHTSTSRYLGIYNGQDWRCYTSYTTDNIKDQSFAFYVLPNTDPSIDVNPESQDFVVALNGSASQEVEITAHNIAAPAYSTSISGDTYFTATVTAGKVTVTYAPTVVGEHAATLTITETTSSQTATVALTGKCVEAVDVATAMATDDNTIVALKPFEVVKVISAKNYVYIKDATGASLIFDYNNAHSMGSLVEGATVNGFVGKKGAYNSNPQLTPSVDYSALSVSGSGTAVATEITEVKAEDVNKFVVLKGVEITSNVNINTNPTLTVNGKDIVFYNQFGRNFEFQAEMLYDIYGFVGVYNETVQFWFLEAAEAGSTIEYYTVTYEKGASDVIGNVPVDTKEYAEGETVTLKPCELTREGYTFDGWNVTTTNGTVAVANNQFIMPGADVTATALWEKVKTYDQGAWVLVTDAGDLAVNDDVIIAAANYNYALGTEQKSNNRETGTIVKGSNVALLESDVQILTLENGNKSGTLALSTGNGYLYAASSSSNYLRTETDLSDNSSWKMEINDEAVATIKAQGTNTNNLLQYNSNSEIFSCYSSAQKPVTIYEYNPNERVITFNVNGGEAYAHTYVATTGGGTLTLPTDVPTHATEGQLFSSWNDKQDGSGNTYNAGDIYSFTEHTTLYAQWAVADAYHVTYNIAGASGTTPVDANHYYGGEIVTLAPQGDLVNPGHIFAGWKVVDATDTEITVTDNAFIMPQSDVTATAKWVRQTNDKWVLVTEDAQLVVGEKYVIACNTEDAVAGNINPSYMNKLDAAFSDDKQVIKALAPEAIVLTLGGTTDAWTFTNESGEALGATAAKNMAWDSGTTTWTLTFDANGVLTMTNTTDSYGALQYNSSNPRFTTYASGQKDIQLYILIPNQVVSGDKTDEDVPQYSNVTVENGGDLFVEKSDTQYGDVYINNGGSVEVDDNAQLTVNNLYISTTMGATTSGQLNTAAEDIIVNGDVFIDITLGKNGDPSQWHAFTVPFPVDAMNGVYDLNDNKLTNEVNYAIMDYHGDLRANGQYGWKKYRGILVPGTFYLMTVDGERTTYRFKKVKGAELIAPATKELKAYNTGTGESTDFGWNGVGNPTLMHGKVAYNAQILDPEEYIYKTITASSAHFFTVGTPFFIQAAGNETMTMDAETSASLAPARRAAAAVENIKVMLGNSDYTDYLYVSASEDATNEYEIGKDLAKMTMTKTPSVPQIFAEAYNTRLCMIDAPMANNEAVVALNLYAPAEGEYTLSIEAQDNEKVYLLHDGTFVWDLSMSEYPITLNKGDNTGYSILVHRADAPTSVETIDGTNNQTEKLIHNGNLYILHNGKVFDAVGTMLK